MRSVLRALLVLGSLVMPGAASASLFSFDSSGDVVLSAAQAPGTWYTDRYAPAFFASGQIGGGRTGVLAQVISPLDAAANRPAAFSSAFYNTQGRKYDLAAGTNALFIDVYVSQAWDALTQIDGRLGSFWATGLDAANQVSSFPILEFNNNRAGSGDDGFRVWDGGGWFNVGGFAGYDQWYRLGLVLDGGQELFYVNGNLVGAVSDAQTTNFGNVILQGYNSGNFYSIAWDNLSATTSGLDSMPEPGTLSMFALTIAGIGASAWRRKRPRRAG